MIPVETKSTTFTYELPGRPGEGDLPCERDEKNRTVTSYWRMEEDDPRIGIYPEYGKINVWISDPERLVWLGIVSSDGSSAKWDKRPRRAQEVKNGDLPFEVLGGQTTFMAIDASMQQWLSEGGLFGLKISGLPSPVVSVWVEPVG